MQKIKREVIFMPKNRETSKKSKKPIDNVKNLGREREKLRKLTQKAIQICLKCEKTI